MSSREFLYPAMAMSKEVAAEHLKLPFFVFVLANIVLANPAAKSCGSALYRRLLTFRSCLVFDCFATAMLLLAVRIVVFVTNAEASAVSAARAAASARSEAFDADKEAAAARRGIAFVPAGWKRGSLRGLLLVAMLHSVAACFHAIVVLEGGFLDRTGCHPGYGADSPFEYILMCAVVVACSSSARVAWYQVQNKPIC